MRVIRLLEQDKVRGIGIAYIGVARITGFYRTPKLVRNIVTSWDIKAGPLSE